MSGRNGTSGIDVPALVEAAARAPSSHNAQPWLLSWHDGTVELRGDPRRALPVADPEDRELRVACGAALANLRLAVRAQGRRAHVRLLPDSDDPWLLGAVGIGGPLPPSDAERELAHAIDRRRTDRSAMSGRGIGRALREGLLRVGQRERAWPVFLDAPADRRRFAALNARAHAEQQADPAFRAEWEHWIGTSARDGTGLPAAVAGLAPRPDGAWRLRDFGDVGEPGDVTDERPRAVPDEWPVLLVVATTADHPLAHLHAGLAMQHILLLATARGLGASFVTPALEVPGTRSELREVLGGAVWPQIVLRLGRSVRPAPATPRRGIP